MDGSWMLTLDFVLGDAEADDVLDDAEVRIVLDDAEVYVNGAAACYEKGDLERAIVDFQKVVKLGGNPKAVAEARKRLGELGAR